MNKQLKGSGSKQSRVMPRIDTRPSTPEQTKLQKLQKDIINNSKLSNNFNEQMKHTRIGQQNQNPISRGILNYHWITHVKNYALKHNVSYSEAMQLSKSSCETDFGLLLI